MYQKAFELIPQKQFTYAFIQLSPWLADRAMILSFRMYPGYAPFPYFSDSKSGFLLNYPAYTPTVLDLTKSYWCETKISYLQKLYFAISDGFKIEILDYYFYLFTIIKSNLGIIPQPTNNKKQLERYFYDQLVDLCKKNSVIPVILKLQYPLNDCNELISYLSNKAIVIDLDDALNNITNNDKNLYKEYFELHYTQGKEKIWFNCHLNAVAQRLFATKIFNGLNSIKK